MDKSGPSTDDLMQGESDRPFGGWGWYDPKSHSQPCSPLQIVTEIDIVGTNCCIYLVKLPCLCHKQM